MSRIEKTAWPLRRLLQICFALLIGSGATSSAFAHHFGGNGEPPPPPSEPPEDPECEEAADPVSPFSGSQILRSVDLLVPGVFPIVVTRQYDSQSTYDSPVGSGWSLSFDARLFQYPDGSVIIRSFCGRRDEYLPITGGFASPLTSQRRLEPQPDGSYLLLLPNGRTHGFDQEGRLEFIEAPDGTRLELLYSAAKSPLVGVSKFSLDPAAPVVIGSSFQLLEVRERAANQVLTGRRITLQYDAGTGRLVEIESFDGRVVRYEFEPLGTATTGNLTRVVAPDGSETNYAYADPLDVHNLTSFQERAGFTNTVNTYDDQDRVIAQETGSRRTTFEYSETTEGLKRTVVSREISRPGSPTVDLSIRQLFFDQDGFTVREIDPLGNRRELERNSQKKVVLEEVYEGNAGGTSETLVHRVQRAVDAVGNVVRTDIGIVPASLITLERAYEATRLTATRLTFAGSPSRQFRRSISYIPDVTGRPRRVSSVADLADDDATRTIVFAYNTFNQVEALTFPDGHVIRREYYALDDPQISRRGLLKAQVHEVDGAPGAVDPRGSIEFDYDSMGFLSRESNADGSQLTERNAVGLITRAVDPIGGEERFTYAAPDGTSPGSLLVAVEFGRTASLAGQQVRFSYTAEGRLASRELTPSGAGPALTVDEFDYDSEGRLIALREADGSETRFEYDLEDKLVRAVFPAGESQIAYDALGRIVQVDEDGEVVGVETDALGRVVSVQQMSGPAPARVDLTYDAAGNVTSVTDGRGNSTVYEYTAFSELARIAQEGGAETRFEYDSRGRLVVATNPDGSVQRLTYESFGPVARQDFFVDATTQTPSSSVVREYDDAGRVVRVTDTAVRSGPLYSIGYDAAGRKTSVTSHYIPGGDRTLLYSYDQFGGTSSLELAGPQPLLHTYQRDARRRLESANLPGGQQYEFDSRPAGDFVEIRLPNGLRRAFGFTVNDEIRDIVVTSAGGQLLHSLTYAHGVRDTITEIVETLEGSSSTTTYGYDALGQLTSAQRSAGLDPALAEAFVYDAAGNRTSATNPGAFVYDQRDRLLAGPGTSYSYDAAGNLSGRSDGALFSFDVRNRLRAASVGGTSATYEYDHLGRRIQKVVGPEVTWYLWDDERLLAEYAESGAGSAVRVVRYAYGDGIAPLQVAFADVAGEAIYDVHADVLGTPRLLTDAVGQAAWRAAYSSYGEASVDPTSAVEFNLRFAGQYFDAESGLHYNGLRYYDPMAGRYISEDPLGQFDSTNRYLYAINAPTSVIDPSGAFANFVIGCAGGALGSVGFTAGLQLLDGKPLRCLDATDLLTDAAKGCAGGALGLGFLKVFSKANQARKKASKALDKLNDLKRGRQGKRKLEKRMRKQQRRVDEAKSDFTKNVGGFLGAAAIGAGVKFATPPGKTVGDFDRPSDFLDSAEDLINRGIDEFNEFNDGSELTEDLDVPPLPSRECECE